MSVNLALPGNPRYQPKALQEWFGYDNLYRAIAQVEIASMETAADMGLMPPHVAALLSHEVKEKLLTITTTQVEETERRVTKHDIRAWILEARKVVPLELQNWLHVMLTSYDAIDTARALQFTNAHNEVVAPSCRKLLEVMSRLVKKYSNELQIGRTHGQHALPITVGFWLATILHRMCYNFREMQLHYSGLVGKISGAVGAYNAQIGLGAIPLPGEKNFEERVLWKLGLEPSKISTQILPPEPLAYYLFSCVMMSASLAQLGRDCRHLMRSEIGEISEEFSAEQSGSSTMAHKRNPINFEQIEGTYTKNVAELLKVLMTPISEHQRDLTGSCVARDFPTIIVNLVTQLNTLLRENEQGVSFLERITVNTEACKRNFQMSRDVILSEPLYIAIQMAGFTEDGHKLVNHVLVPRALKQHRLLVDVANDYAKEYYTFGQVWNQVPDQIKEMLRDPEGYIGDAVVKCKQILAEAADLFDA